ncbi:MAG: aconitase X swivel domain-containing protein [Acetivibrionales bacterium]|jgi:predicted aconitase with swiveling domain
MEEIILKGHKCVKGKASGIAMVCDEAVCFVGGIDIKTGDFVEKDHPFFGENIKGRVMVYPTGKGSTGGAYCLYAAATNNVGPAAIINRQIEQVTAVGAIIADVPVVDRVDPDPIETIRTGDFVEVDADNATIRVIRK